MEFRDAVKYLRSELGLTQLELAAALHINPATVIRWEKGQNMPVRSITTSLIEYARAKSVSEECLGILQASITAAAKEKLDMTGDSLYSVEHASLRELIDDASFAIFVCDMETDELLYTNSKAKELFGGEESVIGRKCYECLMHRDAPCEFCHKDELSEDHFTCYRVLRPYDNTAYKVQGKRVQWNGREAHVRYITEPDLSDQLKSIVDNMNGGVSIVVYNDDGSVRLAYANDRYYTLFGYTKEQFLAELKDPHDTLHPDDYETVGETIATVKRTRHSATIRYRIIRRDGRIAHISLSASVSSVPGLGDKVLISVLTDITDSVEAERQRHVLGQRLDAIMNHINNAVTAVIPKDDATVDFLFSNEQYYRMLGYTEAQYLNEVPDPFRLVHPDDVDAVRSAVMGARQIGDTKELQYRVVCRDGRNAWLRARISVLAFPDVDRPVQLTVYTDVTDMVEANARLAFQRDRIREMVNAAPSGIAVIEVNPKDIERSQKTLYYNDRFFDFSGYSHAEYVALLEHNPMYFASEEDIPALRAFTARICAGDIGDSEDIPVRCRTKDGGYRWLLLTAQLVEKHADRCILSISQVDITERKKAIDRQRISEEILRIAAETDQRTLITYDVNANTCRVESRALYAAHYGETIADIPQTLIARNVVAPESVDELCNMFARIRSGAARVTVSMRLNTGEGAFAWFECNATTIFDADGNPDHAVLVFHNITEQRVKEAVFKKWQQSIESRLPESFTLFRCNLSRDASLDERDGTLLSIDFTDEEMSFNSRTMAYAQQYVYPDDREAYIALLDSDTLLAMFYRGERAATLEYREICANDEAVWRRLTVELVEYIHSPDVQAFLLYENINEEKQAEIAAKEIAQTDPLTGALNRAAFAEKVDSIIQDDPSVQNALLMVDLDGFKQLNDKFGHSVGDQSLQDVVSLLRSYIHSDDLVCRLGGDEFLVLLRNTPYDAVIGKTAQQMCAHIHKAYSRDVQLSASVGIAVYPRDGHDYDELYHNADKALYRVKQSSKGSYAFFSVVAEAETDAIAQAVSAVRRAPQSSRGTKRRMLIVDDNETNRVVLKGYFKNDFLIETAKSGSEAMIRLRHFGQAISVVLLDIVMPGMDGLAVLRRMQNNAEMSVIPVIVVSGSEDQQTILHAIELGAADYVTKPVDADLIRMRVQSAISKSENERLRAQNSYLQLQRDAEIKYRTVLESTGTVVIEYDWRNHVFIYDSAISKHIAGAYDHRGLWQVFLSDMVADSADVKMLQDALMNLATRRDQQYSKLIKLRTPNKKKHWFRMNIYKREDEYGLAEKMILTFNDVHDEVQASEKLLFQATRDELTGLYNRAGFLEKAAEMIAEKEPGYYVMACIDIEKFKVINDQYGTEKGDQVLRHFAQTLSALPHGEQGICCRVNADNFAILYPARLIGTPEMQASHDAISNMQNAPSAMKFYIGRCVVDDKSLPVSAIYDRAIMAKSTIKGRYDAYIATFDESMRTKVLRQQEITGQMNHALTSGQFEVWLQPQFNHTTGMLAGAEALVRWRHPVDGIISPGEFIPIFERNGFVYEVDKYVWEQACKLLRRWLDAGLHPVPVSVNISRYDMFRDDLMETITGLVNAYALPTDLLRLEVTESAFSESPDQIIRVVKELVELGFIVEIDDFGSGYSSLNTLKDVPAQVLKMDMRFLENDTNAQRGGSIVESVVRMARWLGMAIIAEGVETMEQADYLKSIGCEYVQGYLYSRPAQVSDYEKLFAKGAIESKLSPLHAVDTWNNNAFWNPTSMETLIFNSYVGGACIFEYMGEIAELLRYNATYAKIFGRDSKFNYSDAHKDILSVLDEANADIFRQCIATAIATKKEAVCEIQIANRMNTDVMFLRATMRQIAQAGARRLFYCVVMDTTEQRVTQRKQLESSRQLETVMRNVNSGVSAVYLRGDKPQYIIVNDRYYEIVGYTKQQFEAEVRSIFDLIHPEDRARVREQFAQAAGQQGQYSMEYRLIRRDGSVRYIICNTNVIRLYGVDEPVQLAVSTDITELREAQQKERNLSTQMDTIMRNIHGGITATVLHDKDHVELIFANDGFYGLYGYTKAQWEAEVADILDCILPEDRARTMETVERIVATRGSETYEYRCRKRDGSIMWTQSTNTVISLDGVGDTVLLAVSTDITAQKEKDTQLELLTNSIPGGLAAYILTEQGPRVLFFNDGFYAFSGCTREEYAEVAEKDPFAFVFDEDRPIIEAVIKDYRTHRVDGRTGDCVFRCHTKSGGYRWLNMKTVLTQVGEERFVIHAVLLDITDQQEAQERLRVSEELSRLAIRHSGNIIARFDVKTRTLTLPEHFNSVFDLPHVLHNLPQEQIAQGHISPETADAYANMIQSIIRGESAGSAVFQQKSPKGWRWLEAQFTTVFATNGEAISAVISFSDVTERLEQEVVYTKWQQSIVDRPKDTYALFRCNLNRNASYDVWEGALLCVMFDDTMRSFNDKTKAYAAQCVYEGDRDRYTAFVNSDTMMAEYYRNHRSDSIEYRESLPDGTIRWLKLSVDLVEAPHSKEVEAFLLYENIDEQKKAELEAQHMAQTDPLTGLLNRQAFSARVNALIQASKPGTQHAFFMLDIDGFKLLNDTYGHAAGDEALVEVAEQLRTLLRKGDVLGRLGGDEFVLFLNNIAGESVIGNKAEQICQRILKAYNTRVRISVSIGISLYPRDGLHSHELYEKADTALYAAKEGGRNTFRFYSTALPAKGVGADSHDMHRSNAESETVQTTGRQ